VNAIHEFLRSIDISLDQIYLDPNNPRFTEADWNYIPTSDWDKSEIQEQAQRRLINEFGVDKLRMSMEVNGFLPIDRVIVKQFSDNKYIVLEGNRRICAAKMIGEIGIDGSIISQSVLSSLESISCLLYTGSDTDAAWIFQGLRHISGVAEWSAFNKAKLLVEQMEKENMGLTEVGKRFGLTAHGAGQWVRGYHAFRQARQASDYINEVDEHSYPYFQELFGRSSLPIREWLGWDDTSYEFTEKLRLDEFISWIYPRQEAGDGTTKKGAFEQRRIARRDDLRLLSGLLVQEKELFEQFRGGTDLETCHSLSLSRQFEEQAKLAANPVEDLFSAMIQCRTAIGNIPYKAMKDASVRESIFRELAELEAAIVDLKS